MGLLAFTIDSGNGTPIPIQCPGNIPCGGTPAFNNILQAVIQLLFVIGIILALAYFIWGGINWITSNGDKAKVQAARNKIIYAIIGLFVMFLAFAIVNLLGTFFGVHLLNASLPSSS